MIQYEEICAIFKPKITTDMRICCKEHIGKTYRFHKLWTIEENDYSDSRYSGQYAMQANEMCHWVPYEDLEIND